MEEVRFRRGDIVCRQRKYGKEYLRVENARGKNLTCRYMTSSVTDRLMFPKKEAYLYKVASIVVRPDQLRRLVADITNTVYGPLTNPWRNLCMSVSHSAPDVVKISNGWKGYAYFQYVEAARVYVGEYIQIRLEVGKCLEQYDV